MGDRSEILAPPPAAEHDVPDELLELVFLRLFCPLSLVRAACACKRWRRIIADGAFLGCLRSLRAPPLVAGHYRVDEPVHGACRPVCNPVFFPSPLLADAVGLRPERLSLEFLPGCDGGSWHIADSRGGLLVLNKCAKRRFRDLVVCDPTTRRYRVIPPPASLRGRLYRGAFLLDGDAADEAAGQRTSLSNFRIIVALGLNVVARACVFSSGTGRDGGCWTMAPVAADHRVKPMTELCLARHVGNSVYWTTLRTEIITLDKDTAQFSCSLFPDDMYFCYGLEFVGCGGGRVRIARLDHRDLKVFVFIQGSHEWVLENSVPLPQLIGEVQGHGELKVNMPKKVVSVGEGSVVLCTEKGVGLVSVDLATMESERLHDGNKYYGPAYMYQLPWPPTIRACLP
ncbi:uncharacterized protein LOC119279844 [Triticum dicoccoides]|uniref:uncharacterized protein LOC119279844 n=1 Tax=Triticum dicoccoides TaxID=85692 RepID=UPI00162E9DD6|nr:uncharacterized protein LOC119279844 [Triticum dicoccoides]